MFICLLLKIKSNTLTHFNLVSLLNTCTLSILGNLISLNIKMVFTLVSLDITSIFFKYNVISSLLFLKNCVIMFKLYDYFRYILNELLSNKYW